MARLSTMGTASCATIAVGFFKKFGEEDGRKANEAYIADNSTFSGPEEGYTVDQFYDKVLYPVEQDLGRTGEYPFEALMEQIDEHHYMSGKFCIATINDHQFFANDSYWPKQLEKWGFVECHRTANPTMGGDINHMYIRNPNSKPL
jgi:hypothetical protein